MPKSKKLRRLEKQIHLKEKSIVTQSNINKSKAKPKVQRAKQTKVPAFQTTPEQQQLIDLYKKKKDLQDKARKDYYKKSGRIASEKPVSFTDIVLRNIEKIINEALPLKDPFAKRANILMNTLHSSITDYGRQAVADWCEGAGQDIIANTQIYIYDSDDEKRDVAFTYILLVLKAGEVMTPEEAIALGEESEGGFVDTIDTPWEDED